MDMVKYYDFLRNKMDIAPETGILDIKIPLIKFQDGTQLKPNLFDLLDAENNVKPGEVSA